MSAPSMFRSARSLFLFLAVPLVFAHPLFADKLCVKKKVAGKARIALGTSVKVFPESCPSNFTEVLDTSLFRGPAGEKGEDGAPGVAGADGQNGLNGQDGDNGINGVDGEDGSIRIYGDGSTGSLSIDAPTNLSGVLQFGDLTIGVGGSLTVQSGAVIRCTGAFLNRGTITVQPLAEPGFIGPDFSATGTSPALSSAHPGLSRAVASIGSFGDNTAVRGGGPNGVSMSSAIAENIFYPGLYGGGGGGPGIGNPVPTGRGGGSLTILCAGAVENEGTINALGANGADGYGGGGGGVVVLASQTLVTNTGTINVSGGDGGPSAASVGAGGGGGGGLIRLISTQAPVNSGTTTVSAGAAGSNAVAVTSSPRLGGGGGGSSYGAGGFGAAVDAGNTSLNNSAGANGLVLLTTADPTSLF